MDCLLYLIISKKNYLPFLEKHASDMDATISVKKFFLLGSSFSCKTRAVLSQIPVCLISPVLVKNK